MNHLMRIVKSVILLCLYIINDLLEDTTTIGKGLGGRSSSVQPRKENYLPPPQISGATNKRYIAPSEFRRFIENKN